MRLTGKDLLVSLGVALLIVGAVAGGLLQSNIWSGPSGSTIISDTEDPAINEAASTHGNLPITDEDPTLLCFIDEAIGMEGCTAEILTTDWLGRYVVVLETIELDYVSKNGDIYKYKGQISEDLEENRHYKVRYTATDQSGRTDEASLLFMLIELDGTCWVNEIEITSIDQRIYLQTLDLAIRVQVNQDPDDIQAIQLILNGEQVEVLEYASGDYVGTYTLPSDGEYDLLVQILAVGGQSIRVASFNVDLSTGNNIVLLAGATVAILAVSAVLIYRQEKEET